MVSKWSDKGVSKCYGGNHLAIYTCTKSTPITLTCCMSIISQWGWRGGKTDWLIFMTEDVPILHETSWNGDFRVGLTDFKDVSYLKSRILTPLILKIFFLNGIYPWLTLTDPNIENPLKKSLFHKLYRCFGDFCPLRAINDNGTPFPPPPPSFYYLI